MSSISPDELERIIGEPEDENLEFKKAQNKFGVDELTKYCVALANERGGRIVFGVTDKRPRRIEGTAAFPQPEDARKTVLARLKIPVHFDVIDHPKGRVVVFTIASRPNGVLIQYDGQFWERHGEELIGMTLSSERAREIAAELGEDFSAKVVPGLRFDDLDPQAILNFRQRWAEFANKPKFLALNPEQVLRDIEAMADDDICYAGLILFGRRPSIRRYLAQSEVVLEYRSEVSSGPAQQREDLTEGFFLTYEKIWDFVNLRNNQQPYQDKMLVRNIPTFDERAVREGVLNAVCHRHYQMAGSIFVRQFPEELVIESPGGFLPEITPENVLNRQAPRNRRIAEILQRCGLIERSGQGVDLMYERSIRQSKSLPDFTGTDDHTVVLRLSGRMLDPGFVQFLGRYVPERLDELAIDDWLALSRVASERPLPEGLKVRLKNLSDRGLIERVGGGKFILPRVYYEFHRRQDTYDRLRRTEQIKEDIERHLESFRIDGIAMGQLEECMAPLTRQELRPLLVELQQEGRVRSLGERRWTRYFLV